MADLRSKLGLPPIAHPDAERCYGHAVSFRKGGQGVDLWSPNVVVVLTVACRSREFADYVRTVPPKGLDPAIYPEAFEREHRGRPSASGWAHFADALSALSAHYLSGAPSARPWTSTLRMVVFAGSALGVDPGVVDPADEADVSEAVARVGQLLRRLRRLNPEAAAKISPPFEGESTPWRDLADHVRRVAVENREHGVSPVRVGPRGIEPLDSRGRVSALADELGVSRSTIHRWIANEAAPQKKGKKARRSS